MPVDVCDETVDRHGADGVGEEEVGDGGRRGGTQARHGQQQFAEARRLVGSYMTHVLAK